MPRGFFFDNARCTGCMTCVLACADYRDRDAGASFRRVLDYEGGSCTLNPDGTARSDTYVYHLSLSCNHCNTPACVQVCPTGAMHRDEFDLIWPDIHKCIGCGYCTMACPYHAPRIDEELRRSKKCDGCRTRVAEGQKPICVEACPLRALDFGTASEMTAKHPQYVGSILPLPDTSATNPNLFILPSPAALHAANEPGHIANKREAGYE